MKRLARWMIIALAGMTAAGPVLWLEPQFGYAQKLQADAPINSAISIPGGEKRVSVQVTDVSVRTVLRDLAQQGKLNLVLDDSVSGNITLELNNVTLNNALQAIVNIAGLELIEKTGHIYMAIDKKEAAKKGLTRQLSKVIKVNYANSQRIAQILSASVFARQDDGTGSLSVSQVQPVQNDARTNSVVVVGTAPEIALAEEVVRRFDQPRDRKTFYLSFANALDVAAILSSSIYNDGTMSGLMLGQNGGGGGGAGGGGAMGGGMAGGMAGGMGGGFGGGAQGINVAMGMPSTLRVDQEDIEEGDGANSFGTGSDSSGGESGGSSSGSLSQAIKLRGVVKSTQVVNVSPEGVLVVPDTRTNSVTILGTAEQIALAERYIPIIDAQLPQVSIEASLVEISDEGIKELSNNVGASLGRWQFGFNNSSLPLLLPMPGYITPTNTGQVGIPTNGRSSSLGFSNRNIDLRDSFVVQLRALITNNRAKLLANPSIVATHDTEAVISIVDEIVRRVKVEIGNVSNFTTNTVELGDAGIVLNILPKVGEDGTITMRIRPSVTSIRAITEDSRENTITLLSKRDFLAQSVRLQDGQTLVLGGLVKQEEVRGIEKLPGLGDLPIVGALMRSSTANNKRTELVMLITPHIINRTRVTPVSLMNSTAAGSAGSILGGNP